MVGRIYKGDISTLLHTKYRSSGPHDIREEDFFMLSFCNLLSWISDIAINLMQPFLYPIDASDKFGDDRLRRYLCLNVWTDVQSVVPTFIFFLDILHVKKVSNNTISTQQYPLLLRIKSYFQRL